MPEQTRRRVSFASDRAKPPRGANMSIRAIDLFCGAGGLTRGLEDAGIRVALGLDIDPACEYPYASNNRATFLRRRIEDTTASDLGRAFGDARFRVLAGCAPCQPFSSYSQGWSKRTDERWHLLDHFSRLIRTARPDVVTMENVPPLRRQDVFTRFVANLWQDRFHVSHRVVNCEDFGVPQRRRRLVLLASKLGPIDMVGPTTPAGRRVSVRAAIGGLRALKAGEACEADPLHRASKLSSRNLERIRSSRPGGTWRDWDDSLRASCHRKKSGRTYPSVYGRMTWDDPSPTMTTQYYGFGNGRFGHPEQDRAISLREGAILQSFPPSYEFVPEGAPVRCKSIGRLVGNAVPVKLGRAIGKSIVEHLREVSFEPGQYRMEPAS